MKATLLYNLTGILIAILGGFLIQKIGVLKYIRPEFTSLKTSLNASDSPQWNRLPSLTQLQLFWKDGFRITQTLFPYVLLGVGVGALIHGMVPASLIEQYLAHESWYAIPLATLLGAPLYANSVSLIPVIEALAQKGMSFGVLLAFMTSVVTVSIPEMLILKQVMRWQLLALFFGITLVGILFIGYLFMFLH